ncbi:MAG TPA: hypothetical protein VJZ73_21140 [Methylomirabilota bacterium]|nr:hypothetical protein [Methylomirabilota bacterium]
MLTALALLPACGLISVVGVSGRVVDRETGQPIEGAVASLWRTARCGSFHAYSRRLPPAEVRTDAAGRFSVGRGRTATTAPCLSTGWSRTLRILAPGYVAESFSQDDPWLKVDTGDDFRLLKQPVALERVRYALEARSEIESFELMTAPGRLRFPEAWADPLPGPAWEEAIARLASARARPLDRVGVFVRQPGAIFDQIVVVDLLRDGRARPRPLVLARDRRTGTVRGFTERGEPISVPLPAPGFSLVGASTRLAVPLLEKDSSLYYPAELDFAAPLNGLVEQGWTRVAIRGGVRAVVAHYFRWIVLEADGSAITQYKVTEQYDPSAKSRLKMLLSEGARRSAADVVAEGQSSIECLAQTPFGDSIAIAARTAQGRAFFRLSWDRLEQGERWAGPIKAEAVPLGSEIIACAESGLAMYVSLRDHGVVRLSYSTREPDVPARSRFPATSRAVLEGSSTGARNFTGLAAGTQSHPGVLYAVAGDDAIYRFSATGEPDQRVDLDVGTAGAAAPVR